MTIGMSPDVRVKELEAIALSCRVDIIRMLAEAGSGHPGGSLSAIDAIVALFFDKMRHDPARPDDPDRDRFVLSKGHGVPALYVAMAHAGYFPREELLTLRKLGSPLQGHPDRLRFPLIEASTGSLGQGLSIAQGVALASKLDGDRFRVYCLIGDGESQAGQIWEAAMSA
ncbi:MAG: transketolase, partial [Nitrospinota bacterium]